MKKNTNKTLSINKYNKSTNVTVLCTVPPGAVLIMREVSFMLTFPLLDPLWHFVAQRNHTYLSHNKPQHDLTRVGDLSKRLRRLYVRTQDVSSGGSLVNPSPKPSASTRVGFLLHMGQSLLRSSEALSQRMRFQRWPEEMGRAPCMCCPLCRSPSPTLCCTSVHSVSFSGTCRRQHNTISDTSGCCSPTRM